MLFDEHEKRITQIENQMKLEVAKNCQKELLNDMYSRRLNILMFGLKENERWEKRTQSEELAREILVKMKVPAAFTMKFVDCHRLPRIPFQKKLTDHGDTEVKRKPII